MLIHFTKEEEKDRILMLIYSVLKWSPGLAEVTELLRRVIDDEIEEADISVVMEEELAEGSA